MGERRRSTPKRPALYWLLTRVGLRAVLGAADAALPPLPPRARLQRHLDWHPVLFSDKLDESVVCAKFIFQTLALAFSSSSSSSTPTR
jgi:hypothetical protein